VTAACLSELDLSGATVLVVRPGDGLTFVLTHELSPFDGEMVLDELHKIFPGRRINIVSSCETVIHEPVAQ